MKNKTKKLTVLDKTVLLKVKGRAGNDEQSQESKNYKMSSLDGKGND